MVLAMDQSSSGGRWFTQVPKAHQPLLHYVQKQLLRRHRPKAVLQAAGEEEKSSAYYKGASGEEVKCQD